MICISKIVDLRLEIRLD